MYENCPSSFRRKYIDKEEINHEYEVSKGAARGSRIHNGIDAFLKDIEPALPEEVVKMQPFFEGLRDQIEMFSEKRFALDDEWNVVDFMSSDASIRGIIDAISSDGSTLEVHEWKTGRVYPDHADQRSLYGFAGLCIFPELDNCQVTTYYLDTGKNVRTVMSRGMMDSYKWIWARKIAKVQPPQPYPERPNWKCQFCAYSQKKGGRCQN